MLAYIHLIIKYLLYVRYCVRQDQKYSYELEKILYPFVIYNQHLLVLNRVELILEKAPQHLSWTLKTGMDFPRWGCGRRK